jgi:hypothetical protein
MIKIILQKANKQQLSPFRIKVLLWLLQKSLTRRHPGGEQNTGLDKVTKTMAVSGRDMRSIYKKISPKAAWL